MVVLVVDEVEDEFDDVADDVDEIESEEELLVVVPGEGVDILYHEWSP